MTVASVRRPDAGALVPQQQGDGLEFRPHGRRHAAAPGRRLDLTGGSGEHRDDVIAVVDAPLLPRGGTASTGLALAWSSHRLLLWNAAARCHGTCRKNPAAGARNVPGHTAWYLERRAGLRISKDQRSGPGKHLTRTRSRRGWAGDYGTGIVVIDGSVLGTAHVNACEGA